MRRTVLTVGAIVVALAVGYFFALRQATVLGQGRPGVGFAAVPGEKGGQDLFGPYDVVDWPKPLSQLPGHDKWTWGAVQGIFAESPDRVFIVQRGELPLYSQRPAQKAVPDFGPSLSFPVGQAPLRNASQGLVSSPPGAGGPGADPDDPAQAWQGRMGIDARWEHNILVFNAAGDIIEDWTQWDKMLRRPHAVYINPYDPQKYVWIVDDHNHAVFKFSHDGKQLLQTIGTVGQKGADDKHFNRPTFLAWLPDSSMFVSDGYNGHRVVKFDKDGKYLTSWGEAGAGTGAKPETRPNYFNTVHGIATDPQTGRVFVSDRSNHRIQVFDANGKFLDQWSGGPQSAPQFLHIGQDRTLVFPDNGTWKIVKYDLQGHLLYAWGSMGDFPGGMWNVHGMSVDQQSNLYIAEVGNGRPQKFRPRPGANPLFLASKPFYSAWK
jgi:peptidylamidoglycolate lyase